LFQIVISISFNVVTSKASVVDISTRQTSSSLFVQFDFGIPLFIPKTKVDLGVKQIEKLEVQVIQDVAGRNHFC
jgi:hypothetical protein